MGNQVTSELVQAGSEITRQAAQFGARTMREFEEARGQQTRKPGLENFGHTCYMNVSIQSLFACDEFRTQIIENGKKQRAGPIHQALGSLFEEIALSNQSSLSPRAFRDAFVDIHREFRSAAEEHDVQEFMNCLMDELNEEASWHQRDVRGVEPDFATADDAFNYYLKFRANSYLVPLFVGQYQYISTCKAGHSWNRYQSFWSLQLPIPKQQYKVDGTWDIMQCFIELGRPEKLTGLFCEACRTNTDVKRMQTICRVPEYLVISLNVFEYSFTAGKLSPGLRINQTINVIGFEYSLYAVILHHGGTPQSGHYTCFVRIGIEWFSCNDRAVRSLGNQMPDQSALRDTYVLIYEKDAGRAQREAGGARDIDNMDPGLIETSLIDWRGVPLPKGFMPEPPPPPGPGPGPKPPGPAPVQRKFPAWEKKFGDWNFLEEHLRETPLIHPPLAPEDHRFLATKGIYVTNKRLGFGEYGDVYYANMKGTERDQQGRPIDTKLACKIVSLSNYDTGTISVREATERMAKEEELVKKLSGIGAQDKLFAKFRELNLLKKVADTPHIVKTEKIVRIYADNSKFPFPYRLLLLMEVCPVNLDTFLYAVSASGKSDDGLGETRAMIMVAQIGDAVRYLHERYIAHLDIKPQNILIKQNPNNQTECMFKLCDFGLSHERGYKELSESNRHEGDFLYAPPEQLDQQGGAFNIYKADIYALGSCLCDCIIKREPKEERRQFIRKEQFKMYELIVAARQVDRRTGQLTIFDPLYERAISRYNRWTLLVLMHTVTVEPQFRFSIKELMRFPPVWESKASIKNYVNFT